VCGEFVVISYSQNPPAGQMSTKFVPSMETKTSLLLRFTIFIREAALAKGVPITKVVEADAVFADLIVS
jgi:hypothetical protein